VAKRSSAEFVQWIPLVLDALRDLGGSARPQEVYDRVADLGKISDSVRFAKYNKTGNLKFPNQVAFARQYLFWEGLVTSPKYGVWALSPVGRDTHLSHKQAQELCAKWIKIWVVRRQPETHEGAVDTDDLEGKVAAEQLELDSYKEQALAYLLRLNPSEFERFCADLLVQLGMVRVEVLGGAGDKGIDGMGYLPTGPILTTKVAFQCKRYSRPVGPGDVRQFRGAIGHKAEKGILFTTDFFTAKAREAAGEDMAKPIEVVDADQLIELMQQVEFGLKRRTTFAVDWTLLDQYKPEQE
jgi:restriction system protein